MKSTADDFKKQYDLNQILARQSNLSLVVSSQKLQHSVSASLPESIKPFEVEDLQIAPILRKYHEPFSKGINYLIVVRSIIYGACVVKTNIVDLIEPENF